MPISKNKKKKGDTPADVLDYIISNYPNLQLDKIRSSIIKGLKDKQKNIDRMRESAYEPIKVNKTTYYYDSRLDLFTSDNVFCGFIHKDSKIMNTIGITQDNRKMAVYLFYTKPTMTFKQIINQIEG